MRLLVDTFDVLDARGKRRALVLFILLVVGAALEAMGMALIMPFIALISDQNYLASQKTLLSIYETLGLESPEKFTIVFAIALFALFVLKNIYLGSTTLAQYRFIYSEFTALSHKLFATYMRADYNFHVQHNTAILIRNISNEVLMFYNHVLIPWFILIAELLVLSAISVVLFALFPLPATMAILVLGGTTGLFYLVVRRKVRYYGAIQLDANAERIKWINQGLGGIKEIKVLGRDQYFVDAFSQHNTLFADASRYAMALNQLPRLFVETIAVGVLLLSVVVALLSGGSAHNVLPAIALFAMASFRMLPSINRIINCIGRILYYRGTIEIVRQDKSPTLANIPGCKESNISFQGAIKLVNVTYKYPGSNQPSLHGVTLAIPKGSSVAIIGPSGAGKTTLVDIILGLVAPTSGYVLVDGVDIQDCLPAWQRQIGYIPQHIYLSDDTFRRNIAFGVPDALIDDDAIWRALEMAQLGDHVRTLPEGLNAIVGERGVKLSGGQRQRVGIARALYRDPPILILDEATSALDTETEKELCRAIDILASQKTIIIVAHRISTIERCTIRVELRGGSLPTLAASSG